MRMFERRAKSCSRFARKCSTTPSPRQWIIEITGNCKLNRTMYYLYIIYTMYYWFSREEREGNLLGKVYIFLYNFIDSQKAAHSFNRAAKTWLRSGGKLALGTRSYVHSSPKERYTKCSHWLRLNRSHSRFFLWTCSSRQFACIAMYQRFPNSARALLVVIRVLERF